MIGRFLMTTRKSKKKHNNDAHTRQRAKEKCERKMHMDIFRIKSGFAPFSAIVLSLLMYLWASFFLLFWPPVGKVDFSSVSSCLPHFHRTYHISGAEQDTDQIALPFWYATIVVIVQKKIKREFCKSEKDFENQLAVNNNNNKKRNALPKRAERAAPENYLKSQAPNMRSHEAQKFNFSAFFTLHIVAFTIVVEGGIAFAWTGEEEKSNEAKGNLICVSRCAEMKTHT